METPTQNVQKWKRSIFNVILPGQSRCLIFNSSNSQMLELSERQLGLIRDCLSEIERSGYCTNEEMLHCLVSLGFVVPQHEDEYHREREKFLASRSSKDKFLLIIAATMACNLRCSYCFQQNLSKSRSMPPDIQRGLVEFVRQKTKGSKVLMVQWFGGEPLMVYKKILSLSDAFQQICDKLGITYYAEMLTNGTLLTPEIIERFTDMSLKAIQIPLDGKPETYAERKHVSLEQSETFYRFIIEHVQSIVDITGSVTIRVNVDRDNAGEGKEVVSMFKERGITDPRIDFRLGFLNTSRGMLDCIPHDCFSYTEFADLEQDFRHYLAEEGYMVYGMPEPLDYPCAAAVEKAYTIDPQGRIGKCVPEIGTEQSVFSRIYPDDIERTLREISLRDAPYSQFDPFDSQACRGCKLLPACLGSCPKMHEPDGIFACGMKEGLADKLAFYNEFHIARVGDRGNLVVGTPPGAPTLRDGCVVLKTCEEKLGQIRWGVLPRKWSAKSLGRHRN